MEPRSRRHPDATGARRGPQERSERPCSRGPGRFGRFGGTLGEHGLVGNGREHLAARVPAPVVVVVDEPGDLADELLGQQRPDTGGALDRPSPRFERGGPLEEPGSLMAVRFDAELADDDLSVVDRGGGVGTLVRGRSRW